MYSRLYVGRDVFKAVHWSGCIVCIDQDVLYVDQDVFKKQSLHESWDALIYPALFLFGSIHIVMKAGPEIPDFNIHHPHWEIPKLSSITDSWF